MGKIDFNREDLVKYFRHTAEETTRTHNRLKQLDDLGLEEVGVAEFGIPGKMSGLYIERVWHYPEKEWDSYIDWIKKRFLSK